jgi:hypothetical protein
MAKVYLSPVGNGFQFFDNNGIPLAGGLLNTYGAGGSTPTATYTTQTGNVQNANPIVLDSSGRIATEIWLVEGTGYKFSLTNSSSVAVGYDLDNLYGIGDPSVVSVSTQQTLTSGTGATYTRPDNCRQIKARAWGAGGGGGGGADAAQNAVAGTVGGDTIFNSVHAKGGAGGTAGYGGGAGGTGGTGTANVRIPGAPGVSGSSGVVSATNQFGQGGSGGGNGGGKTLNGSSTAGAANSGGGGSGGGVSSVAFQNVAPGSGGGAGEYIEIIINNPSATYTYTIGAGGALGAAGTNGVAGAAGGSGYIIVDEFY